MTIKEKAGRVATAARTLAAAALLGLVGLQVAQIAMADEQPAATASPAADQPQRRGWWFDAGMGGSSVSTGSDTLATGGGGLWVELIIGGRLDNHWLMGLAIGGSGLHAGSGNNYGNSNPYCGCYDAWGEEIDHSMLAVRYLPRIDHGWVFGLQTGPSFYYNNSIEQITGNYSTGSGWGTGAVVGYDWLLGGAKTHVEALLNIEQGHISYAAPLTGEFNYSQVAASVHVAWF